MDAFSRALRDALRYWPLLAISILCSTGVACMWGANIAALYPIIEITLSGKSLQDWNREQEKQTLLNIESLTRQVEQLEQQVADGPQPPPLETETRLDRLRTQRTIEEASLVSTRQLAPVIARYMPSTPYGTVWLIVVFIMGGNVIKQLLLLMNQTIVGFVSASIARDIRKKLFDKALQLDRPTYMSIGTGGFASQITHATEMLGGGIMCFYGSAVTEPLKILVCLAGAWYISWRLLLCSLLVAPIVTVLIIWLNRRIRGVARSTLDRSHGFHHIILESLNNLLTVQAYTMERHEQERFQISTQAMMKNSLWATFYHALTGPITEVFGIGMVCTAILAGSYLVIHRETHLFGIRMTDQPITASGLMIFFGMLISTNDPVRRLSSVLTALNTGSVAAKSLFHMIDTPPAIRDALEPISPPRPHSLLEFRNVSFAYQGHENVLNNVQLRIPFGQRLAIVGPNGGGKSTLMNLLCRFYDPTGGDVLLDGVSLRDMTIADLRSRIALVTQHTEMFNETILFNIRYGRWDATDEEIYAAARQAFAHDFIESFPQKYQTIVGPNGHRLSGGQRQRIALARALLRNAEIMVLDEATSQIDMASEELIHAALRDLGRTRTLLMITHRTSTLDLADTVIRIDRGQLTVERALESRAA